MGGEPTFVSIDDMTSPQWTVAADGEEKRALANELAVRLFDDVAPGGLIQRSQGKWYPGEPLPRWQIGLIWRTDGQPLWTDPALLADPFEARSTLPCDERARRQGRRAGRPPGHRPVRASRRCAARLLRGPAGRVGGRGRQTGGTAARRPIPSSADPTTVAALDADLTEPSAWALPLTPAWWGNGWASPRWRFRRGRLVLLPGDSPAGARMPLSSVSLGRPGLRGRGGLHPLGCGAERLPARGRRRGPGRDPVPDRAGGPGPGRPRAPVPAAAGEAGEVRRAGRLARRGGPGDRRAGRLGGLPAAARLPGEAADGDARSRRDRGQPAPDVVVDRVQRADREPVRDRAPVSARHRDVRPGRPAQRHRRRQPHHPRRSGTGQVAAAATSRPAGQHAHLLAAPPVAVLPVLGSVRRADQSGAAGRRGPPGDPVRAGDRLLRGRAAVRSGSARTRTGIDDPGRSTGRCGTC